MPKLLVIDDDRAVLRLAEKAVAGMDVSLLAASNAGDGMSLLRQEQPDALLLDIMLPDESGIELATQIRDIDPKLPVIFITATEDSGMAIEAMKLGAYEYVVKPLGIEQVQDLVERGLEVRRRMRAPVHLKEAELDSDDADLLVGRSPQMLEVYKQVGRVAGEDVSVLIRGGSGTGKELIARAIYQHSRRADNCFMAVNCAAISETLLESELFGHEKGAFTGAERQHIGRFEQCHGGTVFLDEVGDMSPLTQSKVLRLLQEQKFERVGGSELIEVDVRVISATNRDLERLIDGDEFRLDLLHRLNAFEIHLPPLCERGDDIRLLLEHFLAKFNRQLHRDIQGISTEALKMLLEHPWPGNVRELQSVLRKAMLMATGPVLVPEHFAAELEGRETDSAPPAATGDADGDFDGFIRRREAASSDDLYAESLEWMERRLLTHVLQKHGGNQSRAAEQLGITRGSLRHKLKTHGISISQVVEAEE